MEEKEMMALIARYVGALRYIRSHGEPWSARIAKEALGEHVDPPSSARRDDVPTDHPKDLDK